MRFGLSHAELAPDEWYQLDLFEADPIALYERKLMRSQSTGNSYTNHYVISSNRRQVWLSWQGDNAILSLR
jgi:hypothetical protein